MAQVSTNRIYNIKSELTLDRKYKVTRQPEEKTAAMTEKVERYDGEIIAKHQKRPEGEKIVTVSAPKTKSFPFSLVIGAVICTVMVLFLVLNYAKQYELTVNINRQEKELTKLTEELSDVNAQISAAAGAINMRAIDEDYYGYVPKDQLDSKVISTERTDTVTVKEERRSDGGIATMLSTLYDTIRNIFE